jgi:4-amino-4-deoxy-L-arabinose transferase-like glycosyltransferase
VSVRAGNSLPGRLNVYSPAVPYLAAAAVLAAVYGTGMALTAGGRIGIADGVRRRLTVFSIGFAVLALTCFALGVGGEFTRTSLLILTIVGALLVVPFLPAEARALVRAWRSGGRERWLIVATGLIVGFDAFLASAPPTSGDATAYHLTAPRDWLATGHMFPVWWDLGPFQPFSVEMHYALAFVIGGGGGAVLVGALIAGYSAMCIYGLTRDLYGSTAAAWAALLWVAQGMFLWEATGGFVELALSAFVALAAMHLVAFAGSRRMSDAAWAGLAAGLGMGTKFHGLLFVPVFAVVAAVVTGGPSVRRAVALGTVGVVALVGIPWYIHDWTTTGNPVYPFYSATLGGRYMNAGSRYDLTQSLAGYGMHGIWRLPIFPIEFLLHTDKYERGYSFSPALFVLPLAGLAFGRRAGRLLALGALAYIIVWWEEMQQITRYLLPALALTTPLAGLAAVELWRRRRGRAALLTVLAVTVTPFLAITGLFAYRIAPGAAGTESQAHFVQRLTGTYDAFHWMNENLPHQGRVLVGIRDTFWLSHPSVVFTVPLFNFELTPAETEIRMRRYDVRYVAFFENTLPQQLDSLRLKLLAKLPVAYVTSRTLGRTENKVLDVWAWCGARGNPCTSAGE